MVGVGKSAVCIAFGVTKQKHACGEAVCRKAARDSQEPAPVFPLRILVSVFANLVLTITSDDDCER